jgi:hypothetical protein
MRGDEQRIFGGRCDEVDQGERIRRLNEKDLGDGDYVLYWMQETQRAS